MKMKILFVLDSLRIGGVQSAFLNLLKVINYNKYDVTVQLFHYDKSYKEKLPLDVSIRKMPFIVDSINCSMIEAKQKGLLAYFVKGIFTVLCRKFGSNNVYAFLFKNTKRDKNCYDVAVSFNNNLNLTSTYFGCNMYVLDYVNAKKKLSWLHVDYQAMHMDAPYNNAEYRRFDRIVHVSQACKDVFLKSIPDLTEKSVVVYNVIDPQVLSDKSKDIAPPFSNNSGINIVTVARIDSNKNIKACLNAAKRLIKEGITFNWYILGDGQDRQQIYDAIKRENLVQYVHLLGYISNPYPYISNADILVSTSLSESFGMVIYEATLLCTPVVAYNYPALKEIITHGKNGYICNSEDEISDILIRLCTDNKLYASIKNNAKPILSFREIVEMINNVINL